MLPRIFYVGRPAHLRKRTGFIEIDFKNSDYTEQIPVADLAVLILDHKQITFTASVPEAVNAHKGIILFCDEKHYPSSLCFPLSGNYRNGHIVQFQASLSQRTKDNLWKQIISAKIKNQATLLRENGNPAYKKLENLLRNLSVKNASASESGAAKIYWENLFKDKIPRFLRDRKGNFPNNLLNYGYMVLRAVLVRAIITAGMLPQFPLHHSPKSNALALADDLIEPFRPFMDKSVMELLHTKTTEKLESQDKKHLLKTLYNTIGLDGHKSAMINATLFMSISLAQAVSKERKKLLLPHFL